MESIKFIILSIYRYNSSLRPYGDSKPSNSFAENVNEKLRNYLTVSKGIINYNHFKK